MAQSIGSYRGKPIMGGTDEYVAQQMKAIDDSQPVVAPAPNPATLKGTMVTPPTPSPVPTPTATQETPPNVPPTGLFGANPPATGNTTFTNFLQMAVDRLSTNTDLMKQKNLLVKALYDKRLSRSELAELPLEIRDQVKGFNPDAPDPAVRANLEGQLRLVNDSISGRTNTLNKSMEFLANQYQKSIENAQNEKKEAESNILDYLKLYGSSGASYLRARYPESARLIDELLSTKTLAERQEDRLSTGGGASGTPTAQELKVFINQQIATPEFQALSDEDKALYIQSQGGTPYDFGF